MANHGSIGGGGVRFGGYGTLTNSGAGARIQSTDRGVFLNFGGLLTNGAGAAIIGAAKGVYGRQSESTLTNAGTVQGDAVGIQLVTGARVTNLAGGEIRSANGIGIDLAPTVYAAVSGTIANYGTISSANAQIAVRFAPGVANLLVNHSGAVFDGVVDGGNSVGAAGISTLELAAGGLGTIGGLGTGFVGFTQMTVDGGATWSMQGSNSLDAGATLANSGTLTLFMSSLTDAGALTNDGAIMLDAASLVAAKLVGSGQVTIGGGATFAATGSVASSQTILFGAGTANLLIGAGASFAATIEGFGAGDTIDLTGIVHDAGDTATLLAGNVLHLATTGGTFDLKLDPTQDFTGGLFTLSADGGGSGIGVSGVTGAATGTISTAIAATYTLAFQRTTILSTGTVSASPGPGLLGPAGAGVGWTVDNGGP